MTENDLKWEITARKTLLRTPVLDVEEQHEIAANGIEGDYIAMEAPDWVMVVAEYQDSFVLVRQWRHAAEKLSLELSVSQEMSVASGSTALYTLMRCSFSQSLFPSLSLSVTVTV